MDVIVRLAAAGAALVVVATTWRGARPGLVSPAEERLFRAFNAGPDAVYIPVWAVMQGGSFGAVLVGAAVLAGRDENPETVVTLAVGTIVWAGVKRLKRFIGRGRPAAHLSEVRVRGQEQTGLGYPSGHAAVSMTLALVVFHASHPGVQAAAIVVALVVGGARIYVGAHLPLDVAGGSALGVAVGAVAVAAMTL